jgi:hypothetical protein
MPFNFKEGMRRLGIVVSLLAGAAGAIRGYFIVADAYALSANGFRQESVLVDYCVAALLPVLGFWFPWEITLFLMWIWSGLSRQPTVRGQKRTRDAADGRGGLLVPRKRPGTARDVGAGHEAKRSGDKLGAQRKPQGG